MNRWTPPTTVSAKEEIILKKLSRNGKMFSFLRRQRHRIFDEAFQTELESMYRDSTAGLPPIAPAFLCMVVLLQGYTSVSDAEAVNVSWMDMRWAVVLDRLGVLEPGFAQGTLQQFRERLVENNMDLRLLEKTIELAKDTKEFDWKKLPKTLRIAIDSRPFEGAGRVEDTFNLIGHALRKLVSLGAMHFGRKASEIYAELDLPDLSAVSVKAALDIDWNDTEQKGSALDVCLSWVKTIENWLDREEIRAARRLQPYLDALIRVQEQNLEFSQNGHATMKQGVAKDRLISIEDPEIRHGRKSKTKRFDGMKEHIAKDLDSQLIRAVATTPANRPEEEATPDLKKDLNHQGVSVAMIAELDVDRAYVNSELVEEVEQAGGKVVAKPWSGRNSKPDLFGKKDFKIDPQSETVICPAGHTEHFEPGATVHFDPEICGGCELRSKCTTSASGGRSIKTAEDEQRQARLRLLQGSSEGRAKLRERVPVEHSLARISRIQGRKARYRGLRKNLFALRRAAAIHNFEAINRKISHDKKKVA